MNTLTRFEEDGRRSSVPFRRLAYGVNLTYLLGVDIPGSLIERTVTVEFAGQKFDDPTILVDGPECLRHRFLGGSLCVWWRYDAPDRRWKLGDGFDALLTLIRLHLYSEAKCRQGEPWPQVEAPGFHPRKWQCASCRGNGL